MTKVTLDIERWHNNDADDEDDGPWAYRGTTSGSVNAVRVANSDYDYGYYGMETDLEPPFYVVYCEYMTGDTFGSDYQAEVCGVFENEDEAAALVEEGRNFQGFGELSNGYYVPWTGYFEHLLSLRYERVV